MHLHRRTRPGRRSLEIVAAALAATSFLCAGIGTASATPTTSDPFGGGSLFTDLSLGSQGTDIGDVWVNRAADPDGTGEILKVHIDVIDPGAIAESSVCIKDTAFEDRELGVGGCTGQLEQQDNNGASSADYVIDLGTAFIGDVIYTQIHVTLTNGVLGGTAFGGWIPGKPFYGNTPVPAPSCADGTTFVDANDNGIVDSGECQAPVVDAQCPEGTTGSDVNHNGTIDEGECQAPVVDAQCPEGMTGSDVNHNGTIDEGECQAPVVDAQCPEGTTGSDVNHNGTIDEGECTTPDVTPPVVDASCPVGMTGSDVNHNGTIDEGECTTPDVTPPVVDAQCAAGMTGSDVNHNGTIDAGECVAAVTETDPVVAEVQGEELARTADVVAGESLARTGLPTMLLVNTASVLLAAGATLVLAARFRRRQFIR